MKKILNNIWYAFLATIIFVVAIPAFIVLYVCMLIDGGVPEVGQEEL